ncbi:MAG: hypothetical protein BWY32_01647 [bacterium ADurb.Bin243]|nr:MAG: hypothetical protein BWY32_01647 [bacterium ADurb.Bin243]
MVKAYLKYFNEKPNTALIFLSPVICKNNVTDESKNTDSSECVICLIKLGLSQIRTGGNVKKNECSRLCTKLNCRKFSTFAKNFL